MAIERYCYTKEDSQFYYQDSSGSEVALDSPTFAGLSSTGFITIGEDQGIGIASDAERIVFDGSNGCITLLGANVGIGQASPNDLLDVNGVSRLGNTLRISGATGYYTEFLHNTYYSSGWKSLHGGPGSVVQHYGGSVGGYTSRIVYQLSTDAVGLAQDAAMTLVIPYMLYPTYGLYAGTTQLTFRDSGIGIYSQSDSNATFFADGSITLDSDVIISDTNGLTLSDTTAAADGVIYKGSDRFLHNFHHPTGDTAVPVGQNTFVGLNAGNFSMGSTATLTSHGSYNSALGVNALRTNSTGYNNSAVGVNALYTNSTGHNNSALGVGALYTNSSGYLNSAMGVDALYTNSAGHSNSAVGAGALYTNSSGYLNSAVGVNALRMNSTGYNNSAVGANALYTNSSGYLNSAMGVNALYTNSTGHNNSAVGESALYTNSSGYLNSAMGVNALYTNSTGHSNSAVGAAALYTNSTGHSNSAVGVGALYANSTGDFNAALGVDAGRYIANGTDPNQTSYESVYLGTVTKSSADGIQDEIVIGYGAIGQGAHTAVLGHTTVVDSYIRGNLHIGQGTAGVDYTLTFDGETNDFVATWMEDEDVLVTSDSLLIGDAARLYFEFSGTTKGTESIYSAADGTLSVLAETSIALNVGGGVAELAVTGGNSLFASTISAQYGYWLRCYTTGENAGPAGFIGYNNDLLLGVSSAYRTLILTDCANATKNHDHAAQTNPTLFIQSGTNPDSDNTQWVSITHDTTNAVFNLGTGKVLIGATGDNDIQAANFIASAAGSVDCATNGAYLKPRRIRQADQPTPEAGELLIWSDSDDDSVHLVYNDADGGVVECTLS